MTNDSRIARWAAQQVPGARSNGGRLALNFDDVRVTMLELSDGRVLAQARIIDLPLAAGPRESLLLQAARCSLARMGRGVACLVADADETALWLQCGVAPTAPDASVTEALEHLVNETLAWREVLCA